MYPHAKLSEKQLAQAKPKDKPYKLSVGGALFVLVSPGGGKHWRFKYRFLGKEKSLSIGMFPQISMKMAIEARDRARKQLSEGIDPGAVKQENLKKLRKPANLKSQFRIEISEDGKLTIETDIKIITLTHAQTKALHLFLNASPLTSSEV